MWPREKQDWFPMIPSKLDPHWTWGLFSFTTKCRVLLGWGKCSVIHLLYRITTEFHFSTDGLGDASWVESRIHTQFRRIQACICLKVTGSSTADSKVLDVCFWSNRGACQVYQDFMYNLYNTYFHSFVMSLWVFWQSLPSTLSGLRICLAWLLH